MVATQRYAAAEDLVEKPFNAGFESQNCGSMEEKRVCAAICARSLSLYCVNIKVLFMS